MTCKSYAKMSENPCTPSVSPTNLEKDPSLLLVTVAIVTSFSIIISNIINLIVITQLRKCRTSTKVLYLSLSLSDFICGLTALLLIAPAYKQARVLPEKLCSATGYILTSANIVVSWMMAVLSVERCIIITRPLDNSRFVNRKNMIITVIFVWIFGYSGAIWGFYTKNGNLYKFNEGDLICGLAMEKNLTTAIINAVMLLGCAGSVIWVSWLIIFIHARKHHRRRQERYSCRVSSVRASTDENVPQHSNSVINMPHNPIRKQIQTTLAITLGFYLAWVPHSVRHLYLAITKGEESVNPDFFFAWLAISGSCWNSLCYFGTDRDFRETFSRLFKKTKDKFNAYFDNIERNVLSS